MLDASEEDLNAEALHALGVEPLTINWDERTVSGPKGYPD